MANDTAPGRVIVGVDGTLPSVQALRWALEHAERVGGDVDVVMAWQRPGRLGVAPLTAGAVGVEAAGALLTSPDLDSELAAEARRTVDRCVRLAAEGRPRVHVRSWAMRGPATTVLSELAGPTDLLVVGPTGHRALVGALLGSVATYLVSNARCPVVVVRSDDEDGAGSRRN